MSLAERLLSRLLVGDGEGCWEWDRPASSGYGYLRLDGKLRLAHRLSYETFVGPIPVGLELDHLCRNPRCIRPDHLEPVTHRENQLRGTSPMAHQARQTECVNGHPFSAANTYYRTDRLGRQCRACRAARERARKARLMSGDVSD